MGGHLKERPGRVAHEGGSRDVVDSRLLSRSLWTRLVNSCPDTFGHVGPPHTCFHPCLFPSCSRTPSLSQVIGAVAGAPGPLNPLGGDSGCCQLHALQLPECCSHVLITGRSRSHCGDDLGNLPWAG